MRSRVNWRPYEPGDAIAVGMLRAEQERAVGRSLDTPNLADHPVLISEVAVNQDGEIVGAFFIEAYPTIAIVGRMPKVLASVARRAPRVLRALKENGFRIVQVEIPKAVKPKERRAMMKQAQRIGKKSGFEFSREPASRGFFDLRA